jgi:uncharacterized integral membrane protein
MRFVYGLILVVILGAIGLFAAQNTETLTLKFWNQTLSGPIPLLIGAVYLLGMLSGWTLVGIMRRSFQRVTAPRKE